MPTNKPIKVVIVTHKLFHGVAHDLYLYFRKKSTAKMLLIEHDFSSLETRRTYFTYFDGKKEIRKETFNWNFLPDFLCYIKDFIYSLIYILFWKESFDIFIGAGGFNALVGIILKKIGKVKKCIFYTIDYVPERFRNKLLNKIYHLIDKYCVRNADETWNVSPKMVKAREKYNKMSRKIYNRQKLVPIGIWLEEFQKIKVKKIKDKKQLIFVGHILAKQGLQLVLRAIPKIVKEVPNFNFLIIGDGPYLKELKKLASELKINNYVEFLGPIFDMKKLIYFLKRSHLAVAMYNKELDTFTKYADPTKLKTYLAAGLPIILTDVPHNAKDIEKSGCGKIVKYDVDELYKAIVKFLNDEMLLEKSSKNAINFAKNYDWNKIFDRQFSRILK